MQDAVQAAPRIIESRFAAERRCSTDSDRPLSGAVATGEVSSANGSLPAERGFRITGACMSRLAGADRSGENTGLEPVEETERTPSGMVLAIGALEIDAGQEQYGAVEQPDAAAGALCLKMPNDGPFFINVRPAADPYCWTDLGRSDGDWNR